MSVKILGGVAKGRSLFIPHGETTRPTSVMMRRRLFDSRQDLEDYTFIDACAGTGAMGIEAWSRGAKRVFLIEEDKRVMKTLERNVELFENLEEFNERPMEISACDFERWIGAFQEQYFRFSDEEKKKTIIYFDPPYHLKKLYENVVMGLVNPEWFAGEFWLESDEKKGFPIKHWYDLGLKEKKIFQQGTSYVFIIPF